MANYYGTTVSEGGTITNKEEVQKIINKYTFGNEGELEVEIVDKQDGTHELAIYGSDSIYAYLQDDEDRDEECFDTFLNEVSPFLVDTLIVKEVGNEKCRYVNAYAYIVKPNETCISVSLDDAITSALKEIQ